MHPVAYNYSIFWMSVQAVVGQDAILVITHIFVNALNCSNDYSRHNTGCSRMGRSAMGRGLVEG